MLEYYTDAVSSYASSIDNVFILIFWMTAVWFVLAEGIFFGFCFAFRKKEGKKAMYLTGEEDHAKKWIFWPHIAVLVCDVFIIFFAVRVWVDVKQTLPPMEKEVRVTAQQWGWNFQHPGADGQLGESDCVTKKTCDDIMTVDTLYIEEGIVYHYHLGSKDVMHDFSVPAFRLKQDAIPGRIITGWFQAEKTGNYMIQCAEMCGIGHGLMPARIAIESKAQHAEWIQDRPETKLAAARIKAMRELADAGNQNPDAIR